MLVAARVMVRINKTDAIETMLKNNISFAYWQRHFANDLSLFLGSKISTATIANIIAEITAKNGMIAVKPVNVPLKNNTPPAIPAITAIMPIR